MIRERFVVLDMLDECRLSFATAKRVQLPPQWRSRMRPAMPDGDASSDEFPSEAREAALTYSARSQVRKTDELHAHRVQQLAALGTLHIHLPDELDERSVPRGVDVRGSRGGRQRLIEPPGHVSHVPARRGKRITTWRLWTARRRW